MMDSSGASYSQESHDKKEDSLDDIEKQLNMSQGWKDAEEMLRLGVLERFDNLNPSRQLYISVLLLGCKFVDKIPIKFPRIIAISYKWLTDKGEKIPLVLQKQYKVFFENYKGHKALKKQEKINYVEELRSLFDFNRLLQANVEWIKYLEDPELLMGEKALIMGCATSLRLLFECKNRYSHDYFNFIDYVMDNSRLTAPSVDGFTKFIKFPIVKIDVPWKEVFQRYSRIENTYNKRKVIFIGSQILQFIQMPMSCMLIIDIIEEAIKLNQCETVKKIIQSTEINNFQQFKMGLTMFREKQKMKDEYQKEKEQQQMKQDLKEKLDKEHLKVEEQKKDQQEKEVELKRNQDKIQQEEFYQKLLGEKLREIQTQETDEQKLTIEETNYFRQDLQAIASQLNKIIRVDQLIVMGMLLKSQKYKNLVQLATASGKSFILGIMATYLNKKFKQKVAVITPNDTLAAIQQSNYCILYNKTEDDLWDYNVKEVHYCTYQNFLTGKIPESTILLVDEIDSLFFSDAPRIINGKLISSVLLLSKYKVYGMSATFRGEQGKRKMKKLLPDSNFIDTPEATKERKLKVDVYGEQNEVYQKVFEVTKEKIKEVPVIIILKSIAQCRKLQEFFKQDKNFIFGEGGVPVQLGVLGVVKSQQNPLPIVLTTPFASLGHDIVKLAYVIQVDIPDSWASFVQNMGRGNRVDPNAALMGAFITKLPFSKIEQIKQGCEYEEKKQKLFNDDYLKNLQYLEKLAIETPAQQREFNCAFNVLKAGKTHQEMLDCLQKTKSKTIQRCQQIAIDVQNEGKIQQQGLVVENAENQIKLSEGISDLDRKQPKLNSNQKVFDNYKQQNQFKKNSRAYKLQEAGKNNGASLNQFFSPNKKQKAEDNQLRDQEANEVLVLNEQHQQNVAEEQQEISAFQEEDKDEQINFRPLQNEEIIPEICKSEIIQTHELTEEEKQILQKMQQKGFQFLPPTKLSRQQLQKHNKREIKEARKQEIKQQKAEGVEKSETQSLISERSNLSRNTERNDKGRFMSTGGKRIGSSDFIKRGNDKEGNQMWMCVQCKKRTIIPDEHICAI